MFLKLIDDVRARFIVRDLTEVEIAEGTNARDQQANMGHGSLNRVAFVPVSDMTFLPPTHIGENDEGHAQIVNMLFVFEVGCAGFDADNPERELAHMRKCVDIFEAVVQEVKRAYWGVHEWSAARWENKRKDGRHGAELVARLTLNIPLFDIASQIVTPEGVYQHPLT